MSIWTHVAAVIRYDSLRLGSPQIDAAMRPSPGNTYLPDYSELTNNINSKSQQYKELMKKWDRMKVECNIPCGSEGSLDFRVVENPNESALAAYVVTIWGDLRDYQDIDEIINYFRRITEGKMIRGLSASIEVEGRDWVTLTWANEKLVVLTRNGQLDDEWKQSQVEEKLDEARI